MITKRLIRTITKSCCNSVQYLYETNKPITKAHVSFFIAAGFLAPSHYLESGIFYVQKNKLIATSSFGATKITVRCSSQDCPEKLDEFEKLLDTVVNS